MEIYAALEDVAAGTADLKRFLSQFHDTTPQSVDSPYFVLDERAGIAHLFSIAAGIESMLIGEREIIDQIRLALRAAQRAGTAGRALSSLFTRALEAAERVRSATNIERSGPSLTERLVRAFRESLGSPRDRDVLVIGAGTMGTQVAEALAAEGARIAVASRSADHAEELARRVAGRGLPMEGLPRALELADAIVSSTSSRDFVLTRKMLATAMSRRESEPLLVVDIAVPRDVEPSAAALPGLRLLDLKSLRFFAAPRDAKVLEDIARVRRLVESEVDLYQRESEPPWSDASARRVVVSASWEGVR